ASKIYNKYQKNALYVNNINTKCALYALAAMDVASSGGMICAAPTGGSAGVLPAILYTLSKEFDLNTKQLCLCLLAAGVIGLINSYRSTFAAEIAGCQVEIGMAGAMGCAAVIEAAQSTPENALNAASISLQNTMGSVCDLVAGLCEIPCHTRNAIAASNAFVCADLILGGYINPIPLDETIDASLETGMMLPKELRCTALGGIANTKTAKKLFKNSGS
ncbi:MAG: L-serine ammonia-lyase, iron-sulfur-dependent, subunit beta, partial [Candidatus Hodarchaeales archaeon]